MRIVMVIANIRRGDGQGRVALEICRELVRCGHSVVAVCESLCPELVSMGVRWVPVKGWGRHQVLRNFAFLLSASLQLERLRPVPDVVIANGACTLSRSDINIVHFVHAAWRKHPAHPLRTVPSVYSMYQMAYTIVNCIIERIAFARTRRLVAVSSSIRRDLAELHLDRIPVDVVPNGVDVEEFFPGKCERRSLGVRFSQAEFVVLFVGDLRGRTKNLDVILKALLMVHDVRLVVAGDVKRSPYPKLVADYGLDHCVQFLGYVENIPQLMRACDAFVLLSHYEPFGLVVLEAMASGLPVLTSDEVGATMLMDRGSAEVLNVPFTPYDVSRALERLRLDPQYRCEMGVRARHLAEKHTWERVVDKYRSIICGEPHKEW